MLSFLHRSNFYCASCGRGYYCEGGNPASTAVEQYCPSGWYSEGSSSSCLPCPAGSFARPNKQGGKEVCELCPIGTYQPYTNITSQGTGYSDVVYGTGNADNNCLQCPWGTYSNVIGAASCDGNIPAGIMHIYAGPSNRVIGDTTALGFLKKNESCWAGWHCGYGSDRYMCPKGSYAKKGDGVCTVCPIGSYSDTIGAAECKGCPAKYTNSTNSTSVNDCKYLVVYSTILSPQG